MTLPPSRGEMGIDKTKEIAGSLFTPDPQFSASLVYPFLQYSTKLNSELDLPICDVFTLLHICHFSQGLRLLESEKGLAIRLRLLPGDWLAALGPRQDPKLNIRPTHGKSRNSAGRTLSLMMLTQVQ